MSSDESESSTSDQEQELKKPNHNKLLRTTDTMMLLPTTEELAYRKSKFNDVDVLTDYSSKLECTSCRLNLQQQIKEGRTIYIHQFLKVLFCQNCCKFYGNGEFSLDEDCEDKYCRWCGQGGTLYVCSKCICGFCPKCIKRNFSDKVKKAIQNDDDWVCFICNPKPLWKLRAIASLAETTSITNRKKQQENRLKKFNKLRKKKTSRIKENDSSDDSDDVTESKKKRKREKESSSNSEGRQSRRSVKQVKTKNTRKSVSRSSSSESAQCSNNKVDGDSDSKDKSKAKHNGSVVAEDEEEDTTKDKKRKSVKESDKSDNGGSTDSEVVTEKEANIQDKDVNESAKNKEVKKKQKVSDSESKENEGRTDSDDSRKKKPNKSHKADKMIRNKNKDCDVKSQTLGRQEIDDLVDLLKVVKVTMDTCSRVCDKRSRKLEKMSKISEDDLTNEFLKIRKMLKCVEHNVDAVESNIQLVEKRLGLPTTGEGQNSEAGKMVTINSQGYELLQRILRNGDVCSSRSTSPELSEDIFEVATQCEKSVADSQNDDSVRTGELREQSDVLMNKCRDGQEVEEESRQDASGEELHGQKDGGKVSSEGETRMDTSLDEVITKVPESVENQTQNELDRSCVDDDEDLIEKRLDNCAEVIRKDGLDSSPVMLPGTPSEGEDNGETESSGLVESKQKVVRESSCEDVNIDEVISESENLNEVRCRIEDLSDADGENESDRQVVGEDEGEGVENVGKDVSEIGNDNVREEVSENEDDVVKDTTENEDGDVVGKDVSENEDVVNENEDEGKDVRKSHEVGRNENEDIEEEANEKEDGNEVETGGGILAVDNDGGGRTEDSSALTAEQTESPDQIVDSEPENMTDDKNSSSDKPIEKPQLNGGDVPGSESGDRASQSLIQDHVIDLYDVETDDDEVSVSENVEKVAAKQGEDEDESKQREILVKALEIKRLVLESSSTSSDSDSDFQIDKKKRKRKTVTDGDKPKSKPKSVEDKELKRLLDLDSLSRKRCRKEKEENKPRNKTKSVKNKKESLLDMYDRSDDELSDKQSDQVSDDNDLEKLDPKTRFMKLNNNFLKSILLNTSSDEMNSPSTDSDGEIMKKKKVTPKKKVKGAGSSSSSDSDDKGKQKKKKTIDPLLKRDASELSSSEEESRWLLKKQKQSEEAKENVEKLNKISPLKLKERGITDSDSDVRVVESNKSSGDDDDEDAVFQVKRKKPTLKKVSDSDSDQVPARKRRRIVSQSSDTSSDDKESKSTPSKGRKNIQKMIKKDSLQLETRQALKNEQERKKRIAERRKEYNVLFPLAADGEKQRGLVLDYDEETKEPTVVVHKKLSKRLKPHQVLGVKFMWDNCFESLKKMEETPGSGCILAHCMGLGKTLQVVTLIHTLMTNPNILLGTVLIVCPLSTVSNWISEFHMWLTGIKHDQMLIHEIGRSKKNYERVYLLNDWQKEGGILIISYDMLRNLTKEANSKVRRKKDQEAFSRCLLDPGPDLVVCDEGHLLKNEDTALSKCMRRIKTSRRIVLTGTPLQNNLIEYHCMVQFVKPNVLGTKKEFSNRFVNPINNGQFEDSTDYDVKLMKKRSHVLHSILDGCVQRFDYSVLTPFLPKKYEYVISVVMSDVQVNLYKYYLANMTNGSEVRRGASKLFCDYNELKRIWTHPATLLTRSEKNNDVSDDEDDAGSLKDFVVSTSESESSSSSSSDSIVLLNENENKGHRRNTRQNPNVNDAPEEPEQAKVGPKSWFDHLVTEEDFDNFTLSGKLVLLSSILRECQELDEKVLLFSQSLYSLDVIEKFLPKFMLKDGPCRWKLGQEYFRLDGSTSADCRTMWCRKFNKFSTGRLFLISTRAGGLGINLVAANRVIVFDASWNPSHDVQSIFRVYRFGQTRPCYIYRFLAEATMEEKIYERQVTKLSLACRVVDEQQIGRHYSISTLQELYKYEPVPRDNWKTPMVPDDRLLAGLLKEHKDLIVGYHEHDSLLENKEEEILTEEERKAAWEEYENEKQAPPPQMRNTAVPGTGQAPAVNHVSNNRLLSHFMLTKDVKLLHLIKRPEVQETLRKFYNAEYQTSVWQTVFQLEASLAAKQRNISTRPNILQPPAQTFRPTNPFYSAGPSSNRQPNPRSLVPSEILERGKEVGVKPSEGENILEYLTRVQAAEKRSIEP